jgi:hypothetical protein
MLENRLLCIGLTIFLYLQTTCQGQWMHRQRSSKQPSINSGHPLVHASSNPPKARHLRTTSMDVLTSLYSLACAAQSVSWNREIVYNIMWSILVSLEQYNAAVDDLTQIRTGTTIRKVLVTGLGTGVGGISSAECAQQMALPVAVKHFLEASVHPEKWGPMRRSQSMSYLFSELRLEAISPVTPRVGQIPVMRLSYISVPAFTAV